MMAAMAALGGPYRRGMTGRLSPVFRRENPPQIHRGVCRLPKGDPVQILHPFAGSVQQYFKEIIDPDHYRPDHCPQCEARRPLTAHGFYRRTLVDIDF
jgi:hypothetical protein